MTIGIAITLGVLLVTIGLFIWDRLPLSVVAYMSVLALLLTGVISTDDALAGLANSAVFIVGGMFVVGAGITQTGVADVLGYHLSKIGGSNETRLIVLVMLTITMLSAFMTSTGATAILLPVVVMLALNGGISPSRLMLPLAYGALIGGTLTLIGTPPNIVVSDYLAEQGYEPFGFFAFTPMGLIILVAAILYMLTLGRWLTPERIPAGGDAARQDGNTVIGLRDLVQPYGMEGQAFALYLSSSALLSGHSPRSASVREQYNVEIIGMQVQGGELNRPPVLQSVQPDTLLPANTIIYVLGNPADVQRMASEQGLNMRPLRDDDLNLIEQQARLIEVVLTPRSSLIGRKLPQIKFREKYGLHVLRILRSGKPLNDMINTPLRFGDVLLTEGNHEQIDLLRNERRDMVVVAETDPAAAVEHRLTRQGYIALGMLVVMLFLMISGTVPIVTAVLFAALAMLLSGCLTIEDAYRAMSWESIFVIAGMIPLATALENTGGVELLAETLVNGLGGFGPVVLMAGMFFVTALLSHFASNTVITVLMAPIAYQAAISLGVQPQTFLMSIAVATSAAYGAPTASPVNLLVMASGGFRFSDFARVGAPLVLIVLILSLVVLPILFPLQ